MNPGKFLGSYVGMIGGSTEHMYRWQLDHLTFIHLSSQSGLRFVGIGRIKTRNSSGMLFVGKIPIFVPAVSMCSAMTLRHEGPVGMTGDMTSNRAAVLEDNFVGMPMIRTVLDIPCSHPTWIAS